MHNAQVPRAQTDVIPMICLHLFFFFIGLRHKKKINNKKRPKLPPPRGPDDVLRVYTS